MKIAVPFPDNRMQTDRVKIALDLWENKDQLIVGLIEPRDDLNQYQCKLFERNSTDIGTEIKKVYVYDMLQYIYETFPDEDWYGFGNSDVVPLGNIVKGFDHKEALIFHRTDIDEWEDRHTTIQLLYDMVGDETAAWIHDQLKQRVKTKRICRKLNIMKVPPPFGEAEWHYVNFQKLLLKLGIIFNVGQDMFLFRKDVMDKVLSYLKEKDFIIGSAMWDIYLSRWIKDNFDYARLANRIYHKKHISEWVARDKCWWHNGGPAEETIWDRRYKSGMDYANVDEVTVTT